MNKKIIISLISLAALTLLTYTQITIFVVPPIGAVPEGRTLIIAKLNKTQFIDSPDAMCERMQGGVSLFCRAMMIGAVAKKSIIYLRLPYSETLYLNSTNGNKYDK